MGDAVRLYVGAGLALAVLALPGRVPVVVADCLLALVIAAVVVRGVPRKEGHTPEGKRPSAARRWPS